MKRVTRMGVGLLALIPVLLLTGEVLGAVGVEGVAAAWTVFGVAIVWIGLSLWWMGRASLGPTNEARADYFGSIWRRWFRPIGDGDDPGGRPATVSA